MNQKLEDLLTKEIEIKLAESGTYSAAFMKKLFYSHHKDPARARKEILLKIETHLQSLKGKLQQFFDCID